MLGKNRGGITSRPYPERPNITYPPPSYYCRPSRYDISSSFYHGTQKNAKVGGAALYCSISLCSQEMKRVLGCTIKVVTGEYRGGQFVSTSNSLFRQQCSSFNQASFLNLNSRRLSCYFLSCDLSFEKTGINRQYGFTY